MKMKINLKFLRYTIVLICIGVVYHFFLRPAMLDWGAPTKIREARLLGDQLTGTQRQHTRAILIHAKPEEIWPWISQLGQERGGFYSYTWLENIFLADMHNIYHLKDELQRSRFAGDTIWLATRENYHAKCYQVVAEYIPNRSFVMVSGEDYAQILKGENAKGSWAIYLFPEDANTTWLIARSSGGAIGFGRRLVRYFTFEVPHFIMEEKMLRVIKVLADE